MLGTGRKRRRQRERTDLEPSYVRTSARDEDDETDEDDTVAVMLWITTMLVLLLMVHPVLRLLLKPLRPSQNRVVSTEKSPQVWAKRWGQSDELDP